MLIQNYLKRNAGPDFLYGKIRSYIISRREIRHFLEENPGQESQYFASLVRQVKPRYAILSTEKLLNLFYSVKEINSNKIKGDIVECGVWNGGSSAVMAASHYYNQDSPVDRNIWLLDSFQGLPPPGEKDGSIERDRYFDGWNKGQIEKVKEVFSKMNLSLDNVNIVPGWFDITLESTKIRDIALLHVDCDWHDSVESVLDKLYDKVVPGGTIVIDDYLTWPGCKKAVLDHLNKNNLDESNLTRVGNSNAMNFVKPG